MLRTHRHAAPRCPASEIALSTRRREQPLSEHEPVCLDILPEHEIADMRFLPGHHRHQFGYHSAWAAFRPREMQSTCPLTITTVRYDDAVGRPDFHAVLVFGPTTLA